MTGLILAGGRSSRMGTPKALLPFDGEPLILHLVRKLQGIFGRVVVVAAPGQELPDVPATVVRDEVEHQGPVGGLYYGLRAVEEASALVTSCDSAFLEPALISHLTARLDGHDVVVPRWGGRLQPLVAAYRTSVVPFLERQLAAGELRPVTLFERVRTLEIEEDEIRRFDPQGNSFFNMNRPEDYTEALARWDAARHRADTDRVSCTVELFGVAQLLAGTRHVPLMMREGARIRDVFAALAGRIPALAGQVIAPGRDALVDGYACNVNGLEFIKDMGARVKPGDNIAILSADAGG